ncbi:LOW QUALITY PROTEIN: hypothetical protein V2J09_004913 [Rumex salicifolius]
MNSVIWNVQGAGKKGFRGAYRYLLKNNQVDILVLTETRVSGLQAQKVKNRLNFNIFEIVEAMGFFGGVWMFWNYQNVQLLIANKKQHFIHAVLDTRKGPTHLIAMYAPPTVQRRKIFWDELEEEGGSPILFSDSLYFSHWISRLNLIDMGFIGTNFTRRRGNDANLRVVKRLDRVLANVEGRTIWSDAIVCHLPRNRSNHNPLYLCLEGGKSLEKCRHPFRFESAWTLHPKFKPFVKHNWNDQTDSPTILSTLKNYLLQWNRDVFGNIHIQKSKIVAQLKHIQHQLDRRVFNVLLDKEKALREELDSTIAQEESLWFQKSHDTWIELGDRNTSYLHTSTIIRRRCNQILTLENEWITDTAKLESFITSYFKELYSLPDSKRAPIDFIRGGFPPIPPEDSKSLATPIVEKDISTTLTTMGSFKAPGYDGFQPIFYKTC